MKVITSNVILFVSSKFKSENGYLLGGELRLRNQNIFFIITTIDNSSCLHIGLCEKNIIKLSSNNHKMTFSFIESLPISLEINKPMIVCFSYDHDLFQQSEYIESFTTSTNNCFVSLHSGLKAGNNEQKSDATEYINKAKDTSSYNILCYYIIMILGFVARLLRRSHWYVHIENNYNSICHNQRNRNNTSRIMKINLYSSKVFDLLIGTITLYYILKYKEDIVGTLLQSTKFIINALKDVLNTLMDSPAGLKLNYALNHTLAIFFFYHISLWRAFIHNIFAVSSNIVYIFAALGSFGLSYQIALCADIIMFLTFHVYCIYVYASRFYRVQIYTISSLWRLFIGRKYNPLKQRVDSFQYTHNQLFVGTLGFTVLLFLLPTTFLYYIVFIVFRIWVLVVCRCMSHIANFLSSIPLYLILLRFSGSSIIKGKIRIYTTKNEANSTIRLHASLDVCKNWYKKENLWASSTQKSKRSLNECINNICIGKLL